MKHRLDPLLRPTSVAVVGASARTDSMGEWVLKNLLIGGYQGDIYPVNPRYQELQDHRCYARLADVPGATPELVIFAVGDSVLEAALDEAISCGARAAVIMSPLVLDHDTDPPLADRVRSKIDDANLIVCGANGMGFYNVRDHVWACGFDSAIHAPPGNVTLISHSGAGMSGVIDCDERLRINVAVSTGNEIGVAMDEYLDFALDLPETRAVGLFIETARNPAGLRAAFQKASERRIPIVALKVGRTEASARLTVSHSGAIAGDDAAFEALFDRYGIQRVRDMDEWTTTLIMFAECHPVGDGGLVTLHDSGGERQLFIDLADDAGVRLTELNERTVNSLEEILDPELPTVNPLDAWSRGGTGAGESMTRALTVLMQDPDAALGAVVHDRAPGGKIYPSYLNYMQKARAGSSKPVALVAARQGTGYDEAVVTSTHAGFPVLDGVGPFLRASKCLFDYRDYLLAQAPILAAPDKVQINKWESRLRTGDTLSEAESLELLSEFGIAIAKPRFAATEDELVSAAKALSYPVVLKTAKVGLLHKTEHQGVVVGIADEEALRAAYSSMSSRLGVEVSVAPMVERGVEMLLGAKYDPQFGPIIVLGAGGVLAETQNDCKFALPPFDHIQARRYIDGLKVRPQLSGVRGLPAVDVAAFCDAAERFSELVYALRDVVAEFDVNPLIVTETECVAVDALVVGGDRRDS